jgi:hypothetical protein
MADRVISLLSSNRFGFGAQRKSTSVHHAADY